jgi:hypothetical protein
VLVTLLVVAAFFGVGVIAPTSVAVVVAIVVGLVTALNVAGWRMAGAERGMRLREQRRTARNRRNLRWDVEETDRWPCAYCRKTFHTEEAAVQHMRDKHAAF